MGLKVDRSPGIVSDAVLLGLGELAIVIGVAPSLVSQPLVHGLAVLAALGVAFTIIVFGHATQEKEQAEGELRQSEQRFKAMVQHASDIILVIDADGRFRYVSPAFELVLGYPADSIVGRLGLEFAEPNDIEHLRAVLLGATAGRPSRAELRMRHATVVALVRGRR